MLLERGCPILYLSFRQVFLYPAVFIINAVIVLRPVQLIQAECPAVTAEVPPVRVKGKVLQVCGQLFY